MKKQLFVLGGNDGEMQAIKGLLTAFGHAWAQPQIGWGEHFYVPAELGLEIIDVQIPVGDNGHGTVYRAGKTCQGIDEVIFVECSPKDFPADQAVMVIDHHNDRSGEPAAIRQMVEKLNIWSRLSSLTQRWVELVAANDSGYIPAMLALGATSKEIARVRLSDRNAQGITSEQEVEAERAVVGAEVVGKLTIVRMAHSKTATVADRLFGKADQLLILSGDGEVNFFGNGAICSELKAKFEGWGGGSGFGKSDGIGYWGGCPNFDEVLSFVKSKVNPSE
ncbi:MAG: hypothetical protein WC848_02605 [Parcubacteria group bacterium]|jgi:hypothetical protein